MWTNSRRLAASAAILAFLAFLPVAAEAQSCTQTLSAGANVGNAISSAAAGSTICLNDGSYSGFTLNNVSKNPRVTVLAVNPLGASLGDITITGGTNGITIDGFTLRNVKITGSNTRELTFRNYKQTNKFEIDGVTTSTPNILLENFSQTGLDVAQADPAGIHFSFSGRSTVLATIRNGTIDGGCADGIQSGVPFILENSRIMNKQVGSCPNDPHTDGVQLYGGPYKGTIIRNNYFYRNVQVLSAYDGVDNVLIENNVFDPGPSGERRPCQIEWYSDDSSIIRHNTVLYRGSSYGSICLDRKSSDDAGRGTVVIDNIANSVTANNGSSFGQRSNNLVRSSAGSSDITGTPVYTGGTYPSSFSGFKLANGSPGQNAGLSPAGSDIGADTSGIITLTPNAPTQLSIE